MSNEPAEAPFASRWWLTVALVGGLLAIYWPVIHFTHVGFDDVSYWKKNRAVWRWVGLEEIWTTPTMPAQATNWPLVFTSYWLDYRLFGEWEGGFHLVNVLLHGLGSVLLAVWLRTLGASRWLAWGTCLVFALHPCQVMSVGWVTERKNVLSGVFFFAALTCHARDRACGAKWHWAYVALTACSLMSKSSTIALPVLAMVIDVIVWEAKPVWRVLRRHWPTLLLAGGAGLLTMHAEREIRLTQPPVVDSMLRVGTVIAYYVRRLCWPSDHHLFVSRWRHDPMHLAAWVQLVVVASVTIVMLIGLRRQRWAILAITYFLLLLAPVAGGVSFGWMKFGYASDHLVYLPMVGIILGVLLILQWAFDRRRRIVVFGLCLLALTGQSMRWIHHWQDDATLMESIDVRIDPLNWSLVKALNWAAAREREAEYLTMLDQLIERFPDVVELRRMQAVAQQRRGNLAGARECIEEAFRLKPNDYNVTVALSNWQLQQGEFAEALVVCERALALKPTADILRNAAICKQRLGRHAEAIADMQRAVDLDRFDHVSHYTLAKLCWEQWRERQTEGDRQLARRHLQACLRLEPTFTEALAAAPFILGTAWNSR